MPTYVYETIPQKEGDAVRRFEVRQSMRDEPLARDPETGLPVKRVILGGFGIMTKAASPSGDCGEGACSADECDMTSPRGAHVCSSPFCCRN